MINQQFCENTWQRVPDINREQDLGVPGLRQAKLSTIPTILLRNYGLGCLSKDVRAFPSGAFCGRSGNVEVNKVAVVNEDRFGRSTYFFPFSGVGCNDVSHFQGKSDLHG